MLIRTHLLITLFFVMVFFESVEHKFIFLVVAVLATYIPDIDSKFSKIGNRKILRILQFFIKHRGMIHSFSFLLLITMFFVLFIPILAFGFFLGYGLHLLADSFTITGIMPFYPYKKKISGKIRTGGRSETAVLVLFVIGDLGLFFWKIIG
ncbi:MAG TPA: metal-dependent hydrolase [Candidatus Pacearchaeota archaeon]|nr:inner membrane protein [archaeon BMS3Abin17]HDK42552.1 metal-dependent hydrolase [Candidatus Pacearchaeota archaeon]HDZ60826.1 metal-dependent hydrolase [Candidatus Pacearchaeota archaeon]